MSKDLKTIENHPWTIYRKGPPGIQNEGIDGAKAVRQECVWLVPGTTRRPL